MVYKSDGHSREVILMVKNREEFRRFRARKAMRYAAVGRMLEDEVEKILAKMQDEGVIFDFARSLPNSQEDHEGKDFRVSQIIDGKKIDRFLGVTISQRSHSIARIRHRNVPQFLFPVETKQETIKKRVLELFK